MVHGAVASGQSAPTNPMVDRCEHKGLSCAQYETLVTEKIKVAHQKIDKMDKQNEERDKKVDEMDKKIDEMARENKEILAKLAALINEALAKK
jgi:SMC interacting uncharacterized protein involved in chromosome segregation